MERSVLGDGSLGVVVRRWIPLLFVLLGALALVLAATASLAPAGPRESTTHKGAPIVGSMRHPAPPYAEAIAPSKEVRDKDEDRALAKAPRKVQAERLARTGISGVWEWIVAGAALMMLGVILLFLGRKRRTSSP